MPAILTWIQSNPQAVKAYMVSFLALIAKLILAVTGKVHDLGQWEDFANQAIDLTIGGLTIYGVVAGSVHASRGSEATPADHIATIVAAIQGPPSAHVVDQVKQATEEVEGQK